MTERQRRIEWFDYSKWPDRETIDKNESERERRARIARLELDPEQWFAWYFPKFCYASPAYFHTAATRRILENPEWYEVRMWSRELAKSTRTMMEVFYLVLVGLRERDKPLRKKFVLMISNSLDNAERLLAPYKTTLERNPRIIQDYGAQEAPGRWQSAEFTTRRGITFRAVGVGQSPRGARNDERRPDVIVFDDVDTDADCLNPDLVSKKWRWIEEAAIGTRSISEPTTIIFCGNRIAIDTCIERATRFADHVDEINIRDANGKATWPQKNKEVDIDRVLSQKSYAAQQKEYFNNPLTDGAVFKQMAWKPPLELCNYDMLVCYTDPSYKATNDYKATVLVGRKGSEFHILKCYLEQATTGDMIKWILNIMDLTRDVNCSYLMEQVFMQDVLMKEVTDAGKRIGIPIPIKGDTRQKPDKFMRIETLLEPMNRNGDLYLNEQERYNPHMMRLVEQFTAFAPGSRAHDDGPDAVEGAVWYMVNHGKNKVTAIEHYPRTESSKHF